MPAFSLRGGTTLTIQHWRHLWKFARKREDPFGLFLAQRYEFYWDIIRNDSFVIITAAEAGIGARVPTRFMGLARPIMVGNIAAHDGFVEYCLWWEGNFDPF